MFLVLFSAGHKDLKKYSTYHSHDIYYPAISCRITRRNQRMFLLSLRQAILNTLHPLALSVALSIVLPTLMMWIVLFTVWSVTLRCWILQARRGAGCVQGPTTAVKNCPCRLYTLRLGVGLSALVADRTCFEFVRTNNDTCGMRCRCRTC